MNGLAKSKEGTVQQFVSLIMSNLRLIIEERARNIGNFLVGRLLPFSQQRTIGPFIYIDHMGPVDLGPEMAFDVLPHPHIGLSTLTYLLAGEIMHRDSMGTEQRIQPGAVNWMTAGRGVVHSERTPEDLRGKPQHMHGLQIWVALPVADEEIAPYFTHVPSEKLPCWEEHGVEYRLIAGAFGAHRSAVPVHSRLYLVEITCRQDAYLAPGEKLFGESGLYILEGEVQAEGEWFGPRQILVAQNPVLCGFRAKAGTRLYLLGGDPLPEKRFIDWNFVSSRTELIDQARANWQAGRFPSIKGENELIPMPERPQGFKWT